MKLPNLCNSMRVGCLRYIQSVHEPPELRNPDILVRNLIPMLDRWRYARLDRERLVELRADPFYYYLAARTRYYDEIFLDAIRCGVKQIINIGSGSDTRAYRFAKLLQLNGVKVFECDQPATISAKQSLASQFWQIDHVEYLPMDLNEGEWPRLDHVVGSSVSSLVLMEGVSPYVDDRAFGCFLSMLAQKLSPASRISYDFKLHHVDDDFGSSGASKKPFRLPQTDIEVSAFHAKHRLVLEHLELSSELTRRLLPRLKDSRAPLFFSDALVRLRMSGPEINGSLSSSRH